MKFLTVIGSRPQFIKAAPVSRELRKTHQEILVHTGQHYDDCMSDIFFRELKLPAPDINLNVGSGSHADQTGQMMMLLEDAMEQHHPDWVLLYGDTNSTLAGGLTAAKLQIPIAHIEAGLRSYNRAMPEEINRVLVDHLSQRLFCPSNAAIENLAKEGIRDGVYDVGDVMVDAQNLVLQSLDGTAAILDRLGIQPKNYLLLTVHRAENTDRRERLESIVSALHHVKETIVFPVHPRTRKALDAWNISLPPSIIATEPAGYVDMVALQSNARLIVTDSGGVQKEAYWLGVPCITLREETEWVETVEAGWNRLTGTDGDAILSAIQTFQPPPEHPTLYGDGHAAERIVHTFD